MATVTLSISDELKEKMDEHSEIKWSEVFRNMIIRKLEQLKKFSELEQRGEL